jgi:hypothetical protein
MIWKMFIASIKVLSQQLNHDSDPEYLTEVHSIMSTSTSCSLEIMEQAGSRSNASELCSVSIALTV